jgi:hypothetical protein
MKMVFHFFVAGLVAGFAALSGTGLTAQQPDAAAVIRHIDEIAESRVQRIAAFTVTEHYAVFRGQDEVHPVAEMTVDTTYRKGTGKSYEIAAESGSALIRRFGLRPLLDNEKSINLPANRASSWFTSANYEMQVQPGVQAMDGHACLAIAMHPKRAAPNMIEGTLWADAKDFSIVRIEGMASKNPSIWSGPTHMMRQYRNLSGFAMATHARAESNGIFGRIVVTIDYRDYQIQLVPLGRDGPSPRM